MPDPVRPWFIEVAMRNRMVARSPYGVGEHPYRAMLFDTHMALCMCATFRAELEEHPVEQARKIMHVFTEQAEGWCLAIYDRTDHELLSVITYNHKDPINADPRYSESITPDGEPRRS